MNLSPLISETEARAISRLPVYGNDEFHAILNLVADAVVHRASRVASGNLGLRLSFPEDPDSTLPRTGEQVFTSFSPDEPVRPSSDPQHAGDSGLDAVSTDDPAPISSTTPHAGDSEVRSPSADDPAPISFTTPHAGGSDVSSLSTDEPAPISTPTKVPPRTSLRDFNEGEFNASAFGPPPVPRSPDTTARRIALTADLILNQNQPTKEPA